MYARPQALLASVRVHHLQVGARVSPWCLEVAFGASRETPTPALPPALATHGRRSKRDLELGFLSLTPRSLQGWWGSRPVQDCHP